MAAEKVKDTLTVPITIPTWGLVTLIGTGIFSSGMIYNQIATLNENYQKSASKIEVINDRQIENIASIRNINGTLVNHDVRIIELERIARSK